MYVFLCPSAKKGICTVCKIYKRHARYTTYIYPTIYISVIPKPQMRMDNFTSSGENLSPITEPREKQEF